jgi:hypothetical protein
MNSFIKKIVTVDELKEVAKDLKEIVEEDNQKYGHAFNLKHDIDLMLSSFSHESLLLWNAHLWAHNNGEKWDGVFGGLIRKNEKFGKKMMDEYIWVAKKSNAGIKLFNIAQEYAIANGCEFIFMNVVENHPSSELLKKIYKKIGFQKDSESYAKKLI